MIIMLVIRFLKQSLGVFTKGIKGTFKHIPGFFQSINLNLELFEGFKPFLFCFFCSFSIGSLVFIKTGLKRRIQLQFLSSKKRRSKDQKKTCNFSISSSGVGPFALGILILCPIYLHIMILFKFQTVVQFFSIQKRLTSLDENAI